MVVAINAKYNATNHLMGPPPPVPVIYTHMRSLTQKKIFLSLRTLCCMVGPLKACISQGKSSNPGSVYPWMAPHQHMSPKHKAHSLKGHL